MYYLLFLYALIVTTYGQAAGTCDSAQSAGPSLDGTTCPQSGFVVDTDGNCCPQDAIITTPGPATTVATTVVTLAGGGSTQIGVTATTVSTGSTGSSASTGTTCVDLLNPSTGVSDCPARASLCNDATYYAVMTQQCPKTCGRCSNSTTSSSGCVDLLNPSTGVSDCPARASLCNDATYYTVMTQQCPKTCGRCNSTSTNSTTNTTTSGSCVDLLNPLTGVSDCPNRTQYCTNSAYISLMRVQCPKTCGFCSSSSNSTSATASATGTSATTASGTCADLINPNTGTSDCPGVAYLCTNAAYATLMRIQCPLTCGLCSG